MKQKQDTNLNKNKEDLKFDVIVDDILLYNILLRQKPT